MIIAKKIPFNPFLADSDDVFVTQKMWEGEYYFDKNKIPKTWQNIFSYQFVKTPWTWCFKQRCKSFVGLNLFYQIEHMTNTQPNAVSQTQAANIQCRLCNSVTWHHIYNLYTKQGAIFKCQKKQSNSIKFGQNGFQMYLFVSNITFVSLQHWFAALKYAPVKKCKYVSFKEKVLNFQPV